jgi:hypothetical protein
MDAVRHVGLAVVISEASLVSRVDGLQTRGDFPCNLKQGLTDSVELLSYSLV